MRRGLWLASMRGDLLVYSVLDRVPLDVVPTGVPPEKGSHTCPLAVTVAIPDDNRVLPVVYVTRILLEVDTISDTPLIVVALTDGEVHGKSISW